MLCVIIYVRAHEVWIDSDKSDIGVLVMASRGERDPERVQESSIVSELHLALISKQIVKWEGELACGLGLKRPDITVIQYNNNSDYSEQKFKCLLEWRKLYGDEATYGSLLKTVRKCGQFGACSLISELLKSKCILLV